MMMGTMVPKVRVKNKENRAMEEKGRKKLKERKKMLKVRKKRKRVRKSSCLRESRKLSNK